MTRARTWLLGTGIACGTLTVLLAVVLFWLLYTPSGLRFALDHGVAWMHGEFAYTSASGSLAGTTTIHGLRYRDASGDDLRIQRASLDLQPWTLLARRLHVSHARIDGITLKLAPASSADTSQGFSLQPPLTLVLDDTRLSHITLTRGDQPPFIANSLVIAGAWSSKRLVIRQLTLHAPAGSVSLDGTLSLARGYPGQGTAKFDWTQHGTHHVGTLTSTSDGKLVRLQAKLSAPATLVATASLALNKEHTWTLALTAPEFDPRAPHLLPASIQSLALDLHGAGDARGGRLQGDVSINGTRLALDPAVFGYDGKTLTLTALRLRSPEIAGNANVTGAIHLAAKPLAFALDAQWNAVQIPATLASRPLATHGNLHLQGTTKQFALQGGLALGPPGHLSDLKLDLVGTPRAIMLHTFEVVQAKGGLDVHGRIGLQPRASWQLDAVATHFDPGAILPGWDGALDFTLATTGAMTPRGPSVTLQLAGAHGTLRGLSISGSKADFKVTPANLLQGAISLVAGNSRFHAIGKHGPRTNATLSFDVASLRDWLPDAAGRLQGQFTLKGSWPKLAVVGHLQGQGLRVGTRNVDTLHLTTSIPDLTQPGGKLDLELQGVHAGELAFTDIHLQGGGTAAAQHLRLHARGNQLDLGLTLAGAWQPRNRRWTGTLSDVAVSAHALPAWHQQQPSTISWHAGTFALSRFCLSAGTPNLCLSAQRSARAAATLQYTLQQLPLQLLTALLPAGQPLQTHGELSGTGKFSISADGAINGTTNLAASAGSIAYAASPERPLLAWSNITLNARAQGTRQQANIRGDLNDGGHINGEVSLSGSQHTLAGSLNVNLHSLDFLTTLSPEIANVQGALTGNLTLAGTLAAPQFQGRINTRGFAAELPRAGLKLHAGQFAISGDAQGQLAITGQITSGTGVLHIDGHTGLAVDAPLTLTLQGDNVLVADIPAARVVASPDLTISRAHGVFALTGSVAIPSARVKVEKLPGQGPAQASPDVVIVDQPASKPVAPLALDANVEVKLGNAVKLQGYGLDGSVHGQLAVRTRPGHTATGRGEISIDGKYQAYGQNLDIERGRLLFAGTRLDNPGLDIRAVRKIRSADITVGLSIRGTAQRPVLTVFSDPAMEQAEALSYLVTGRPLNDLKSGEGDTLNTAAQALGGLAGDRLAKSIGSRLGLEAGVSSSEALGGSAFTAGKYLSPRLFLSYGVGLFTPGQVITLRYTLNRFLQFEAENATTGNRASLNYRIEK